MQLACIMGILIYKILTRDQWNETRTVGVFPGAPDDRADGFIHLSTASQLRETAARHFSGCDDLVLASVDEDSLGTALKWEISRGGKKFPHLYGRLTLAGIVDTVDLPLGPDGSHEFPQAIPK